MCYLSNETHSLNFKDLDVLALPSDNILKLTKHCIKLTIFNKVLIQFMEVMQMHVLRQRSRWGKLLPICNLFL